MTAVYLVTPSALGISAFVWAAVAVMALVAILRLMKPSAFRRISSALTFALACAFVVPTVVCAACGGCDPWWLEYFWVCI